MRKNQEQKASIAAIAQHLGLSQSTVYAALSGMGTVSQVTCEKVRHTAQELGYRPNLIARSMRTQRTGMIGVILPSIVAPLNQELMAIMMQRMINADYHALFSCALGDRMLEEKQIEHFLGIGIEGLILNLNAQFSADWYSKLAERIPLVLMDQPDFLLSADVVGVDQVAVGVQAAEHLLSCGRRQLAFVPAPQPYHWIAPRWQGFQQTLAADGVTPRYLGDAAETYRAIHMEHLSLRQLHGWQMPASQLRIPPLTQYGYAVLSDMLENGGQCDGIFAANDQIAYGVLQALADAGRRVPDDVAVIGCDDLLASEFISPALTTFHLPMEEIGVRATDRLLSRLTTGQEEYQPTTTLLPSKLVVRESSGGIPA
ncbi:MAG TPA: LacI family DNA-binding transcriptional regulator [Armatimonadota bacterium]|jgi:LacI family transcriptional regulator